jgi:hypothetical protein
MRWVVFLAVGAVWAGGACGSSGARYPDAVVTDDGASGDAIVATDGRDAGTSVGVCQHLTACACLASDACLPVSTACWCPTCDPSISCVCGGGTYYGCQDKTCPPASCGLGAFRMRDATGCVACDSQPDCATALGRVQLVCGGADIDALTEICATDTPCVAACLANLGACAEVNCRTCQTCTCTAPTTPFSNCIDACHAVRTSVDDGV